MYQRKKKPKQKKTQLLKRPKDNSVKNVFSVSKTTTKKKQVGKSHPRYYMMC